jgi:hypothetical protein
MRGRSGILYGGWPFAGAYAAGPAVDLGVGLIPVRVDDTFNGYADGELSTVAAGIWAKNGSATFNVASGDVLTNAIVSSVTFGRPETVDGARPRAVTLYDLNFAVAFAAAHSFNLNLDAPAQTAGSGNSFITFTASTGSGAQMALTTSSGTTTITLGPATGGGFINFGTVKLALDAGGTARMYRNGSLLATRAGAAQAGAKFAPWTHNRGVGDANAPDVSFTRWALSGYA